MDLHSQIEDLEKRVALLERAPHRTTRGHCTQRRAADYIGCSREHLRQLHLRGEGPKRNADGTYSYDNLDAFREGVSNAS